MTLHGVLQGPNSKLIIGAFSCDNGVGEKDNSRLWIGTHFFFKLSLNSILDDRNLDCDQFGELKINCSKQMSARI